MRHKQQTQPLKRILYTQDEIDKVGLEVNGNFSQDSRRNWLVSKGALKIRKQISPSSGKDYIEEFIVRKQDGMFLYSELSDLWEISKSSTEKLSKSYPIENILDFSIQNKLL
jgi:hypothetical protein